MQTCGSDSALMTPPATGVDWPDLLLGAAVVALGVGALWYVRRGKAARPYVTGGLLGLLFAISLVDFGRPVGISGAFLNLAGARGVTWPVLVAVGVFVGGFVSSSLSGRWRVTLAPFGSDAPRRWINVFLLAVILEISAAIAGGCTSGLALSGGIALSPGAFVFMAAMFAGGVPAALLAWRRR